MIISRVHHSLDSSSSSNYHYWAKYKSMDAIIAQSWKLSFVQKKSIISRREKENLDASKKWTNHNFSCELKGHHTGQRTQEGQWIAGMMLPLKQRGHPCASPGEVPLEKVCLYHCKSPCCELSQHPRKCNYFWPFAITANKLIESSETSLSWQEIKEVHFLHLRRQKAGQGANSSEDRDLSVHEKAGINRPWIHLCLKTEWC